MGRPPQGRQPISAASRAACRPERRARRRDEGFPVGLPAGRSRPCQKAEHGAGRAWRDRGAAGVAAQQLGQGPGGLAVGGVSQDAAGRGDLDPAGALPDQQGGDEASMRRLAGGKLEHEALLFLDRRERKRVQEALLRRLAQGGVAVERGQRSRRKMGAGGLAAAASAKEGHAAPERGRGDAGGMAHAKVLHRHGDRRVSEHDVHDAQQDQAAALGQRACVENTAEVFGRERRRHRDSSTLEVGRAASYAGRVSIVERLLPSFRGRRARHAARAATKRPGKALPVHKPELTVVLNLPTSEVGNVTLLKRSAPVITAAG